MVPLGLEVPATLHATRMPRVAVVYPHAHICQLSISKVFLAYPRLMRGRLTTIPTPDRYAYFTIMHDCFCRLGIGSSASFTIHSNLIGYSPLKRGECVTDPPISDPYVYTPLLRVCKAYSLGRCTITFTSRVKVSLQYIAAQAVQTFTTFTYSFAKNTRCTAFCIRLYEIILHLYGD